MRERPEYEDAEAEQAIGYLYNQRPLTPSAWCVYEYCIAAFENLLRERAELRSELRALRAYRKELEAR